MSLSDLLAKQGGRSFKFDHVGATVTGTVVSADVMQKRNFDSGEPEFWADGKPVEQVAIVLDTSERDPSDPEDDGKRSIYIKGWGDQLRALRAAIRSAQATDIEPGGTFTATYVKDGELPPGKRGFAPKVYTYEYRKPSSTAGLIGGGQQSTQAQQQAPASNPQDEVDLTGLNLTPEQLEAIKHLQRS